MTATPPVVLAKSRRHGQTISLADHTRDVLRAVRALFGTPTRPTRLAQRWLQFFGLGQDVIAPFYTNLWLAATFHDIGKANDGFQNVVRGKGSEVVRHEHLSALILWRQPVREWLRALRSSAVDAEIVVSSVLSHHLKANSDCLALNELGSDSARVQMYLDARDFAAIAGFALEEVEAPLEPLRALATQAGVWEYSEVIAPTREALRRDMYAFDATLRRDRPRRNLLLAVKAAVLAADAAGSAAVRVDQRLEDWIEAAFTGPPLTETGIWELVINPRIAELRKQERWTGFHGFQDAAAQLGPRALLLSSCGSGKTLAAWRWIATQVERTQAARVLFLYPTRATATEGFRDYVSWSGSAHGALVSGTAPYDLDGMFANTDDWRRGRDYTVLERLFALGYWHKRVFSATVDSFLSFVNNRYAALCLVPLLADSVVVVDEVHSFDKSMFRSLDRFLEEFSIPVMCMTASLPRKRIKVLEQGRGMTRFPSDAAAFADLERQAHVGRYRAQVSAPTEAHAIVLDAFKRGRRVMWVVNTVRRCQAAARMFGQTLKEWKLQHLVLCYHSRFRLVDRKSRHERVMREFRDPDQPRILVTTQVCEMSLDLDADVLITEAAPVPSLIQRMGRCCRHLRAGEKRVGEVYIYSPDGHVPYEKEEVAQGQAFASWLAAREAASHADLSGYLAEMDVRDPYAEHGFVGFLDGGAYAMTRDDSFREDDEYTVDCVLDSDVDAYVRARKRRDAAADGLVLPVPRRFTHPDGRLNDFLLVAAAARYHPEYGFLEEECTCDA